MGENPSTFAKIHWFFRFFFGKGGARKKHFESKLKKSLAQLFYIGHTMYVNHKRSWIRALIAEIIDFVDDGIF